MTVTLCSVCGRNDFNGLRGRRIHEAQVHGLKVVRHVTKPFSEHPQTKEAAMLATTPMLAWAAGFLEGEGCFSLRLPDSKRRKPGLEVTAASVDLDTMQQLLALFGGMLRERKPTVTAKRFWSWSVYGARALGVAQTLYPMLKARRQATIRRALIAIKDAYAH